MRTHIENLGEHGVVYDVVARSLPPNAWSGGSNVSTYAGNIASVRGYKSTLKTPTYAPYWLLPWLVDGEQQWVYAGWTGTAMTLNLISSTTTEADVSRASAAYTSTQLDRWTGGVLGGVPVATNGVDEPQIWDSGTSKFQDMSSITGWTAGDTCRVVKPHRSFLVAADITESGTRNRAMVRWTDPADPGSLPTTWDWTDATKLSGRTELSQTDDPIVDLIRLGEDLLIYRTKSVWRMSFMEHSLLVFDFAPVFESFGAAALGCVADTGDGRHIVYTGTDLVMHDGRQAKSILTGRAKRRLPLITDVGAKLRSFMTVDRVRNEVWFCYPLQGNTWPTRAFLYNWETGDTGWRNIPATAAGAIGDLEDYEPDETWDSDFEVWNDDITLWDDVPRQGRDNMVLCGSADTKFYGMDIAYTLDGEVFQSSISREDLTIEGKDPDEIITITGMHPKLKIAGDYEIDLYIGMKMLEEDSVTWKGPYRFNPSTGRKVDFLATGRWPSVRINFLGKGNFSLSGYSIDWERAGWR